MANPKIVYYPNPNILSQPNNFLGSAWTQPGVTVTPNFAIAPDGTLTASKVAKATIATSARIQQVIANADGTTIYTIWLWVKAGSTSVVEFAIFDITGNAFQSVTSSILIGPGAITSPALTQAQITGLSTTDWTLAKITGIAALTAGHSQEVVIYPGGAGDVTSGDYVLVFTPGMDAAGGPVVLPFSYPPVAKPGVDDRNSVRHDAVTTSGIRQSIWERTEVFKNLQMDFVPQADLPAWKSFVVAVEQGALFYYVPDSSLNPFNALLFEDMAWTPQRAFFGFSKFKMKMRVVA